MASPDTAQTSTKPVFVKDPAEGDYGCKILHDPVDAVVDIIFVHGLTGSRRNTWTKKWTIGKQTVACFWPEHLLPIDIENARISTWGYDADVVDPKLFHMALLHASEAGSDDVSHIRDFYESTRGILFMGTPHEGSSHAKLGGILSSIVGLVKKTNKEVVKALTENARPLVDLQERFFRLLGTRRDQGQALYITCCFEELDTPVIGTIVTRSSATLAGYEAIGIHANHTDMTKFSASDSPGYAKVVGELQRWVKNLDYKKDEKGQSAKNEIHHHGDNKDNATALYGNQSFSGTTTIGGQHSSGTSTFNAGE
ncbi:hypothetical protein B0A49_08920 [Cryomyces minteri]|uniref:DUF676 domain-containing protein n=1 Tax=Cryomyces minteri TaxID=331657 RepID=A0A4V5NEU5_9PEZI|nr:hypothetical protein B0A49_08920 [Cryomyces minteri]